jgi:hypothetical protein
MTSQTVSGNPARDTLIERVRAAIGDFVAHPEAVDFSLSGGRLTLKGSVLQREHARLIRRLGAIPGVIEVQDDHLAVHASTAGVTALQGGGAKKHGALILTLLGTAAALILRAGRK